MGKTGGQDGRLFIELGIFLCVGLSIAFFFLPGTRSRRIVKNENMASAILGELVSAQRRFRHDNHVDTNGDGVGGFAFLHELLGRTTPRLAKTTIDGAMLSHFGRADVTESTVFESSGYLFVSYLCNVRGEDVLASSETTIIEEWWIGYAWPLRYGDTGRRLYTVNHLGQVRYWNNELPYSGRKRTPPAWLATPLDDELRPLIKEQNGWQKSLAWRDI